MNAQQTGSLSMLGVRIGLIGCGAIGRQHADAIRQLPLATLATVHDPNQTRMAETARSHDARAVDSAQALCERDNIDAVVIATPTNTHRDLALMAMQAGKHVLLEKPVCLTLAELDEIQLAARNTGVVLLVGQSLRFDHITRTLHESVDAGDLGPLALFQWVSNTARPWPGGWRGWQTDPAQSGGMALHLGIHSIDLAIWLMGSAPARVYAQGANLAAPGLDVNDYLHISLRFENQANALLEVQSSLAGQGNRYQEVYALGPRGQAQWRLSDDRLLIGAGGMRFLSVDPSESMRLQMSHFVDCCQGRAEPIVTPEQARRSLATALAANESLKSGQAVDIANVKVG